MSDEEAVEELKLKLEVLGKQLERAQDEIYSLRRDLEYTKIVAFSKLTRRQQKMWFKWIQEARTKANNREPELKSHFSFPKVGLQAMNQGKYVVLTGTTQKEGLTKEEGVDICEYLNSFPENQHQMKNLDSEFRNEELEEHIREELKKL